MSARGVETPGVGIRTTAHLNLTRSLADVWWWPLAPHKYLPPVEPRPRVYAKREPTAAKIPYAGIEKVRS